eukprot:8190254-Pyramimonas_sp.AAC.1
MERELKSLCDVVFPVKGERQEGPHEVAHRPGETRPMALENTSKKVATWSISLGMKLAAGEKCVDTPRGFLRGR